MKYKIESYIQFVVQSDSKDSASDCALDAIISSLDENQIIDDWKSIYITGCTEVDNEYRS